jgi:hypothetical protein
MRIQFRNSAPTNAKVMQAKRRIAQYLTAIVCEFKRAIEAQQLTRDVIVRCQPNPVGRDSAR